MNIRNRIRQFLAPIMPGSESVSGIPALAYTYGGDGYYFTPGDYYTAPA